MQSFCQVFPFYFFGNLYFRIEVEKEPKTLTSIPNYSHDTWPNKGIITIKNCFSQYRPNLPFVLKNITFEIKGSEKVSNKLYIPYCEIFH